MSKTHFFILGNGFSINLIKTIELSDKVDLKNLFRKGDEVLLPNDSICLLSRRICPDLWGLGARSTMSEQESIRLISDIITSTNVYYLCNNDEVRKDAMKGNYYKAYCQLISYLKNLFIYYNKLVTDEALKKYIEKENNIISYIKALLKKNEKIRIITYNYDIFLERMLKIEKMDFSVAPFNDSTEESSIVIYKPHGSISFESKDKTLPGQPFNMEKDPIESATMKSSQMSNNIDVVEDLSIINPIIPPAGDSNRIKEGWSHEIKNAIDETLKKAGKDDNCVIYGISYDHVDRNELDTIITNIPWDINICYINPFPSSTFDMVLGSIFSNYCHYKDFYGRVNG